MFFRLTPVLFTTNFLTMKKQDIFLLLLLFAHFLPAQKIWEAQNPNYPPDHKLFGLLVSIVNENVAWTAAEAGDCSTVPWAFGLTQNEFARTTDGGKTWKSGTYPTSGASIITSLYALDSNVAWITLADFNEGGKVLKTSDGGQTWIVQNTGPLVFPDFVHFFDANNGVLVGDSDSLGFQIFRTSSGGASWQRIDPASLPASGVGDGIYPFYAAQGNHIWGVTPYGRVIHSPDKGVTWEAWGTPLVAIPDYIDCHDNTCIVSFGDYSDTVSHINKLRLFRTTDRGINWKEITPVDNNYAVNGMKYVPNTGTLIAAFVQHNVNGPFETRISHDDGSNWQTIDEGTKVLTLFFYDNKIGYGTHFNTPDAIVEIYRYVGPPITSGLFERKPLDAQVALSPNPTAGLLQVEVQGNLPGDYLLSVSDAFGRVVQRKNIVKGGNFEESLDLSGLPAGVYFVALNHATGRYCSKVVKQ